MQAETLLSRITINPEVLHGKPTVRNMRYSVESILDYLAAGDTPEDIIAEFPDLQKDDVLACIAYAAASMKFKDIEIPAA